MVGVLGGASAGAAGVSVGVLSGSVVWCVDAAAENCIEPGCSRCARAAEERGCRDKKRCVCREYPAAWYLTGRVVRCVGATTATHTAVQAPRNALCFLCLSS